MPLVLKSPLVNGALPPKIIPFTTSFTLEPKTSIMVGKAMVIGKYGIWECRLNHLEGCLLSGKNDAAEFSEVFIANGKHDIG